MLRKAGGVKVVRSLYPAHWRYFAFIGAVVGETADSWLVATYGPCDFTQTKGFALGRK